MNVSDFLKKVFARRQKFSEMQDDHRLSQKVLDREKSSDERELERYIEENRQARIKAQLAKIRKQKNHEMWHSKSALDAPNMFNDNHSMLRERNIFVRSGMAKERAMFFNS